MRIQQLKKESPKSSSPESLADYALLADAMEAIVADFKETLKKGMEINDLDVFIDRLERIQELKPALEELKEALVNFPQLPKEVKIASVNEFLTKS